MAHKTPEDIQEKWINVIKNCGQSLINNAESIAGDYEFQTGVDIAISLEAGKFAEIEIKQKYFPASDNGEAAYCPTGTTYHIRDGEKL